MYEIVISKTAKKKLQSLSFTDRTRISEKILRLGEDPDHISLDVKKMVGQPFYRLRVGGWRIIFDREDELKIISIEKIGSRGDIYK